MDHSDIANARLNTQQITGSKLQTARDIVGWMGALQAQDFPMTKWALGVRLPGITEQAIENAFNKGEILRTHLLRPTWHMVTAEDIHWLLELTAPRIKASMRTRDKGLGINNDYLKKSYPVLQRALNGARHLTKDEIVIALQKEKINPNYAQIYHLLMNAELDGLICSGVLKGKDQTYALLAESPKKVTLSKPAAAAKLAEIYFRSHGPATIKDFAWWSGLGIGDIRQALNILSKDIISEEINTQVYWYYPSARMTKSQTKLHLLPAFDEFIISYRDRSPALQKEHHRKAVSSNGVFRPVVVYNGQVIGLWKRTFKKDKVFLEINLFGTANKNIKSLIAKEAEAYGIFLGKPIASIKFN